MNEKLRKYVSFEFQALKSKQMQNSLIKNNCNVLKLLEAIYNWRFLLFYIIVLTLSPFYIIVNYTYTGQKILSKTVLLNTLAKSMFSTISLSTASTGAAYTRIVCMRKLKFLTSRVGVKSIQRKCFLRGRGGGGVNPPSVKKV